MFFGQLSMSSPFQPTPSLRRATADQALLDTLKEFQPTPSLRRATGPILPITAIPGLFQPTPSLRRATLSSGSRVRRPISISTHALLAEGDVKLPVIPRSVEISTHALLAEGDQYLAEAALAVSGFQPTPSLRRATSSGHPYSSHSLRFQPTPSLRRATRAAEDVHAKIEISTHALLAEGDSCLVCKKPMKD